MVSNETLTTRYSGSVAEIDLRAMDRNLDVMKKKSGKEKVLAVVKANAYGHGAVPVALWLEGKVIGFAVAGVDEGIQLRKAGIVSPILVFGVPDGLNREAYLQYDLTATISHLDHFALLLSGTRYQINIDTGMRRLGLFPEQADSIRQAVSQFSYLDCTGVYSHYATADEPGSGEVPLQQKRFQQVRESLSLDVPYHMSNTAAVMHYDLDSFDIIRVGIGLTGYTPGRAQHTDLEPVLHWKTRVSQSRLIRKGEAVSYGGNWTAPQEGYLLTLPVGYADGVPRSLTNRLHVVVSGESLPQVGNITMDHMMVFADGLKVEPGTEVQLMAGAGWRANRWAQKADTITHEIFCRLTPRVQRRYLHSNR